MKVETVKSKEEKLFESSAVSGTRFWKKYFAHAKPIKTQQKPSIVDGKVK